MPNRKVPLVTDEIYHVYNKSIADYKIFNSEEDYERMKDEMVFYAVQNPPCKFSYYKNFKDPSGHIRLLLNNASEKLIEIITYCIMPTHIHLILKELKEDGIRKFMTSILKSYSHYFNLKHNRRGPLWENRFQNVLVNTDEQFIHLTRYIHLNPVTAYIVNDPGEWKHSSYIEYIGVAEEYEKMCNFSQYLNMDASSYKKFVNDNIDYQRNLAKIKNLILE